MDTNPHNSTFKDVLESAFSYLAGGGSIWLSQLDKVASVAQDMAMVFGCLLVIVRLVHDSIRLYRYIRHSK